MKVFLSCRFLNPIFIQDDVFNYVIIFIDLEYVIMYVIIVYSKRRNFLRHNE